LVTEDGLHLATSINDLPEAKYFALGEEVLAMLTHHAYTQAYEFAHGTFGAFRIRDGMVAPMTRKVTQRRQDVPLNVQVFQSEVRRMLR
jgi:hypothetical protein